jgi:hypothetical protein
MLVIEDTEEIAGGQCKIKANLRSARAGILEFHPTRPEDHMARRSPNPKFIFKYVTRTPPKPDFLFFQPG